MPGILADHERQNNTFFAVNMIADLSSMLPSTQESSHAHHD
jgi:hypothetical protein